MSLALHPVRLWWADGRGVAKAQGRPAWLHQAPQFPGFRLELEAIDYAPGIVALITLAGAPMRDMTPAEIHAARELLRNLTTET